MVEAKAAMEAAIQAAVGAIANAVQGAIGKIGSCLPIGTEIKGVSDNTDSASLNGSCSDDANVEVFNPVGIYKEGQRVKKKDYDGKWCYGTVERDDSAIRPGICPKYKFVPDDETSYGYEKYVKETYDYCKTSKPDATESDIYGFIASSSPWEYKAKATWNYISNYSPLAQFTSFETMIYEIGMCDENGAPVDGSDPEVIHAYGKLAGDYTAGLFFEGFFTELGECCKYANAARSGEEVSKESVIAGSGVGNLGGGKGKAALDGGSETLTRRAAFRKAKRAAGIPNSSQHKKPKYVYDGTSENRWVYEFDEYTEKGYQKFIVEHREDKFGRGPHFHGADSGGDVSPLQKGRYNQYDGHYPENFDGYKK